MQFDWLDKIILSVSTPKFFVHDGPADDRLRAAIEGNGGRFPRSYTDFVLRYGNAKFYRKLSYYIVGVLASPHEQRLDDGEVIHRIGHRDSSSACFRDSLLVDEHESPVFHYERRRLRKVASGFEEWLVNSCKAARRRYRKAAWDQIVAGPEPFSEAERGIVEARRRFTWRVVGTTSGNNLLIEVRNNSETTLPYLSVGARSKAGTLNGGLWLDVSNIAPGQVGILEKDAYKKHVNPGDMELFDLPDPGPEDRSRYWEFRRDDA